METFKTKISIKAKLLMVLVGLSSLMLITYAYIALSEFERDKIAYVFDSTKSQTLSVANQVRTDLEYIIEKVQFFMRGYSFEDKVFHAYSQNVFSSDNRLDVLATYQFIDNKYVRAATIQKKFTSPALINEIDEISTSLINEALISKVSLRILPSQPSQWLIALRFGEKTARRAIAIGLINSGNFLEAFTNTQRMFDTYLLDRKGDIVLSPVSAIYKDISVDQISDAAKHSQSKIKSFGSTEYRLPNSSESLLASMAKVNIGELRTFSIVPKSVALEAILLIMAKSALFLLLIICLTIFISVIASTRMTATLKRLFFATQEVSKGNFDIEVAVTSADEIGGLAAGFNSMTKEISRLMAETAEKARMENELQTAQLVQSTLFPESEYKHGKVVIRGFYQSASECGGDWWFHNTVQNKTFLWIGDATGHGVPAALVTSAARSAANILQEFPDLSASKVMGMLNRAIYGTAKGQVLMTFFFAVYNHDTDELTYCNASHDPPYLFPYKQDKIKKNDILPLMEKIGSRLGEKQDTEYQEVKLKLNAYDKIVFYTDGVTELYNPEKQMLGERKFIQCLLKSFNNENDIKYAMDELGREIDGFKGGAPLADDVTYFMFQRI